MSPLPFPKHAFPGAFLFNALPRPIWSGGLLALFFFVGTLCASPPAEAAEPVGKSSGAAGGGVPADHAAQMTQGLELFRSSVRGSLVENCVACHGGNKSEADFDLTDRARLIRGGAKGPGIVVGKAKESLLFQLISHAREPAMPLDGEPLSTAAIADIGRWIDLGAPYDKPLVEKQTALTPWYEKRIPSESRKYWAFQPLREVISPKVRDVSWCRTPIDRFILHRLEGAGLTPSVPLPREKLVRRVYFDVLGLPPTPEEIAAFVDDPRPDAYPRLIDRLLASPKYGERWARPWLDLVRYAESHGYEQDYDRPHAYQYRDFVIEALNRDLPYTTFIKWQIAGDEYEPENNLALKATGYLAAGVHPTQITANEVEKCRYDELDDIVNNIGTTMLGLSLGCCRCHDHKYDPVPQGDYYRMAANFSTTVRSDQKLILNRAEYQGQLAAWEAERVPLVAALSRYDAETFPANFSAWNSAADKSAAVVDWTILESASSVAAMSAADPSAAGSSGSSGSAALSLRADSNSLLKQTDDGSIVVREIAGGAGAEQYHVILQTRLSGMTGLRLEAFSDPELPGQGPGRGGQGNALLTNFAVFHSRGGVASASSAPPWERVAITAGEATNSAPYGSIRAAFDDNSESGWDLPAGKEQVASFEFAQPVPAGSGGVTTLLVQLSFQKGAALSFARFRLAATTLRDLPELTASAMPESVQRILAQPATQRSGDLRDHLREWRRATDPARLPLQSALRNQFLKRPEPRTVTALISSEGVPALRLHTQGADFFEQTYYLRRGDVNLKEGTAASGYLQALMPHSQAERRWWTPPPAGSRTSYRRRALAEWLTDVEQGAGSLAARVMVNRIWQGHLGRGLVATPSDFGARGEKPTHPELIDWLAGEFVRHGWSMKHMHRLILTSAVYLQSSAPDPVQGAKDPGNSLCWRKSPRRLEAETIRDSLLFISQLLDLQMYGPGTLDPGHHRRSIYFTVKRSKLVPMLQVFDAPDALSGLGERPTTTVAPQALLLLNNPEIRKYARAFARHLDPYDTVESATAIRTAYRAALGRSPSRGELRTAEEFVRQQQLSYADKGSASARQLALADFCQTLFCLNEFVYVD